MVFMVEQVIFLFKLMDTLVFFFDLPTMHGLGYRMLLLRFKEADS